jgi:hypothetical protein
VGYPTAPWTWWHPPYFNVTEYGEGVEGDLSRARSLVGYPAMLKQVAGEVYRVLKPGGVLGILLGDTRVGGTTYL